MKSLYQYIDDNIYESAVLDVIGEIVNVIKTTTSSFKDGVNTLISIKKELRNDKQIRHEEEVERILLYMINDEDFVDAIRTNQDDMYMRKLLQSRLHKEDIRYIKDIIAYVNKVKQQIKEE